MLVCSFPGGFDAVAFQSLDMRGKFICLPLCGGVFVCEEVDSEVKIIVLYIVDLLLQLVPVREILGIYRIGQPVFEEPATRSKEPSEFKSAKKGTQLLPNFI